VLRSFPGQNHSQIAPRSLDAKPFRANPLHADPLRPEAPTSVRHRTDSRVTALNIEFVAKPQEAHKIHAALPAAIDGALGSVAGFAGSFVLIANHEARLVTVVTLWSGEDRLQRCAENERWVRALVAPYLDRCLRIQTLAAYVPASTQVWREFEPSRSEALFGNESQEEPALCLA
jgi:hypothetical protein